MNFFSILTIPICESIRVVNGSAKYSIMLNQGSEFGETDNCSAIVTVIACLSSLYLTYVSSLIKVGLYNCES